MLAHKNKPEGDDKWVNRCAYTVIGIAAVYASYHVAAFLGIVPLL